MMSDERLAEIRQRDFVLGDWPHPWIDAQKDRHELLAAYDEQRAEVERLREGDRLLADAWDEGYQACLRQWNRPANADRMPERNPHIRAALNTDEGADHAE